MDWKRYSDTPLPVSPNTFCHYYQPIMASTSAPPLPAASVLWTVAELVAGACSEDHTSVKTAFERLRAQLANPAALATATAGPRLADALLAAPAAWNALVGAWRDRVRLRTDALGHLASRALADVFATCSGAWCGKSAARGRTGRGGE